MSLADGNFYKKTESCPALSTVIYRTPTRTLCTNDFDHGAYMAPKPVALKKKHIRLQSPNTRQVFLFDIDHEDAFDRWSQVGMPPPTWIALNPKDGKGHYGYALSEPITNSRSQESRATSWARSVYSAMVTTLGSDSRYNEILTKNPLHPYWFTYYHDVVYSLGDLAEYLDPKLLTSQRIASFHSERAEGRNEGLFHLLRSLLMREWAHLASLRESDALAYVESTAVSLSLSLYPVNPLPVREVVQVARSVCKWLLKNFNQAKAEKIFRLKQQRRQARSAKQRREITHQKLMTSFETLRQRNLKPTVSMTAELAGCSRQAIYKHHQDVLQMIQTL
jgi:hypothetical protein